MSSSTTAVETRPRLNRRRFSTTDAGRRRNAQQQLTCQRLPRSLEALDLSTASAKQTLASLRFLILSYLADLETTLSQLESPTIDLGIAEVVKAKGELTVEEARIWAKVALEMLDNIRADVRSHLPDFHFADISVENLKSHLPDFDLPDVASFNDMRSRLPDMVDVRSHLPDFSLADMSARLDEAKARFADLDFQPLNYIPVLSDHLQSLHKHLTSLEMPSGYNVPSLPSHGILSDLVDALLSSEFVAELKEDVDEAEDLLGQAAQEVKDAVKRSFEGACLIHYHELPKQWRNNPFVTRGYRFIPLEKWPLIVMSLFAFHNETLNIHTHLVPFIMWSASLIPFFNSSELAPDGPEVAFTAFALVCLFSSVLWHTMAGCAHPGGMELCARVDYVGIGWLISASVGTIVYYGFQCYPHLAQTYLLCCLATGIAGNIFPFMDWFNSYEYRYWRILFFLSLAFTAVAPLATLAYLHGTEAMMNFANPVWPSLASYITGLVFYATHVPERWIAGTKLSHWLDCIGGGSHAIWHGFIVLAISQHKQAMGHMRNGIDCQACH